MMQVIIKCQDCKGGGWIVARKFIAGIIHKVEQRCTTCNGQGRYIKNIKGVSCNG